MITFHKMHGLGNDFVIIDERNTPMQLIEHEQREEAVRRIAARKTGIGCDQLIVLRPTRRGDAYMQIFNADGSEVGACGNATRCVAWLMMRESRKDASLVETENALLECYLAGKDQVKVNMGLPLLDAHNIPLADDDANTLHVSLDKEMLADGVAVNMGNPHLVYFVDEVGSIPLKRLGPELEYHPLFPQRVNVNVAQIDAADHLTVRTWERGAGETLACGTGACATAVAARRRALTNSKMTLQLPGGELIIEWKGTEADPDHPVWMTGPLTYAFKGELPEAWWV
jgi:diaminopimelate epimerase